MSAQFPEPDDNLDIDRAFEQIVAHWDAGHAESGPAHPGASGSHPARPDPAATPDASPPEPDLPDEFVAPVPPPLRTVSPRSVLAWVLILGSPTLLLVLGLMSVELSRFRVGLAAAAFALGCGLVVTQLRGRDDDPPPDDGAVV